MPVRRITGRRVTVGHLKRLLAGLPDDAEVFPDWAGRPGKSAPVVELVGFAVGSADGEPHLSVLVKTAPLEE